MAVLYCPVITETDDEAFRRVICIDFPDTYNKWLYLANKRSLENVGMGHESKPVEVNPDEFARFLRATGAEANVHSLYRFAYQKGEGHKY